MNNYNDDPTFNTPPATTHLPPKAISAEIAALQFRDDYGFERFSEKPKKSPEVSYEFTRDKALLDQYFRLREEMFISVWGLRHFYGQEDAFDKHSHILIAKLGKLCVGGARITVKTPRSTHQLPMESENFLLEKLLPGFNLPYVKYGEFSRLSMLPDYRQCTREMYRTLNRKSVALGLQYIFAIAPLAQARGYRQAYKSLGMDYRILDQVAVPERAEFEGIKMCLSMLDLTQQVLPLAQETGASVPSMLLGTEI